MRPIFARLAFGGFIVLSGAIATNALYFQQPMETKSHVTGSVSSELAKDAPRPASESDRKPSTSAPLQSKQKPADEQKARPAPKTSKAPSRDVVRAIQRELAQRNYEVARRDGRLDVSTRLAILNYQYQAGLKLTGKPSEAILRQILFGPYEVAQKNARIARLEADRALVGRVKRILSGLGFANLKANGRMSAATRRALRQFAQFRDLRPDGRLSPRLLLELSDITDEPIVRGRADDRLQEEPS